MSQRFVIPLLIFLVMGGFLVVGLERDPDLLPSALIDQAAPDFVLPPIAGRDDGLRNADLDGQVSIVNVFASWCVPCRIEHPQLVALSRQPDVRLFGINKKDQPDDVLAWLESHGDPFTRIGADTDGRASLEWGVYGVPETFILDPQGRIRYRHVGPIMPGDLEETLLPLIDSLRS